MFAKLLHSLPIFSFFLSSFFFVRFFFILIFVGYCHIRERDRREFGDSVFREISFLIERMRTILSFFFF